MFRDRKKAIAMTLVLGVLLAMLAGVLLPAAAASPSRFRAVEAYVQAVHGSEGPADPSWAEYRYEFGEQTYIVRFEGSVESLREGDRVRLYANIRLPHVAMQKKPPGSDIDKLVLIILIPIGLLFAGAAVNCVLVFRKEKADANP